MPVQGRAAEQRIGPYRLLERIGAGGMGSVHLAVDANGNRVAVKMVHPHIVGDQEGRERLAREVAAMRRVVGPSVAEVIDADFEADPPYIVTRYVSGLPLDRAVEREGRLARLAWLKLGTDLAQALVAIHSAGVVHRDLKPGNVLLAGHGAVVIDFGLAQLNDESRITRNGTLLGTPGYLAPEIIDGDRVSAASDVHSWAATMVYAATGRPPYGTGTMNEVLQRVLAGRCDLSGVPMEYQALIAKCLSRDPNARPSAWQLHDELSRRRAAEAAWTAPVHLTPTRAFTVVPAQALPTESTQPPPQPPPQPTAREPRGRRLAVLLMLALFVGAATVVPVAAGIAYFAWVLVMGLTERCADALARRRAVHGRRRSDGVVSVAVFPWHLLRSALSMSGLVLFAAAAVTIVLGLAWLSGSQADQGWPASRPTLAVAAAAAVLVSWWGPGGATSRRGAVRVARSALPRPVHRFAASLGLTATTVLLASAPIVAVSWPLG